MKRVSERHDAIVAVEVVLEPIEVQVPPVAVPVQVRHIQVAVAVAPDKRTRYRRPKCLLLAERHDAAAAVEAAPEPIEAQAPPAAAPAQVRHTQAAVAV